MIDYKGNHPLDSPVKLGFCLIKAIDQCTNLDLEATTSHWYFKKSLYKKLAKMSRGFEILKMIHQSPKVLIKTRVWDFIKIS